MACTAFNGLQLQGHWGKIEICRGIIFPFIKSNKKASPSRRVVLNYGRSVGTAMDLGLLVSTSFEFSAIPAGRHCHRLGTSRTSWTVACWPARQPATRPASKLFAALGLLRTGAKCPPWRQLAPWRQMVSAKQPCCSSPSTLFVKRYGPPCLH